MVLGIASGFPAQDVAPEEELSFKPAEALSVTDIPVPTFPASMGTVVLDAVITETGKIEGVEVRRDLGYFSQLSINSVEDWTFSPAKVAGKAVTSRIPIAVTFRPPYSFADPVPLPKFVPQSEAAIQAEFQPAEVLFATFPIYPRITVISGTVILEVTLSAEGKAEGVRVLRDVPPLTDEAEAVVGNWRYMAATWNGHAVRSKIVMAFLFGTVYQSP
jgi:outer membrane biosynthesis protein TonB